MSSGFPISVHSSAYVEGTCSMRDSENEFLQSRQSRNRIGCFFTRGLCHLNFMEILSSETRPKLFEIC